MLRIINTLQKKRHFTTTPSVPKVESFYRRPLPKHLISFSSTEGKTIFKQALEEGGLESYWSLAEQFHTQSEPAYCGLATLTMVLNALQIDPKRLWKGPWRWFSEDLLDCCSPLEIVKKEGITWSEFSCLARCHGADIEAFRATESSLEQFRQHIKGVTKREGIHLVVSFSRTILGQTGDGHFSAVSGYNSKMDLALVMDTAKFKYPAFWAPVPLLYESMQPVDSRTGHPRGYFLITKGHKECTNTSCKLTSNSWAKISKHLSSQIRINQQPRSVKDVILLIFKQFPAELSSLITMQNTEVLDVLPTTKLHSLVKETFEENKLMEEYPKTPSVEFATLILLAFPSQFYKELSPQLRLEFHSLRNLDALPSNLSKEILALRYQMNLSECSRVSPNSFDLK